MKMVGYEENKKKAYWMNVVGIKGGRLTVRTKDNKVFSLEIQGWESKMPPEEFAKHKGGRALVEFVKGEDGKNTGVYVRSVYVPNYTMGESNRGQRHQTQSYTQSYTKRESHTKPKREQNRPAKQPTQKSHVRKEDVRTPPKMGKVPIERAVDEIRNQTNELYFRYLNAGYSPDEARNTILNVVSSTLQVVVLSAVNKDSLEKWIAENKENLGITGFNGKLKNDEYSNIVDLVFSQDDGFDVINRVVTRIVKDAVSEFYHEKMAETGEELRVEGNKGEEIEM